MLSDRECIQQLVGTGSNLYNRDRSVLSRGISMLKIRYEAQITQSVCIVISIHHHRRWFLGSSSKISHLYGLFLKVAIGLSRVEYLWVAEGGRCTLLSILEM